MAGQRSPTSGPAPTPALVRGESGKTETAFVGGDLTQGEWATLALKALFGLWTLSSEGPMRPPVPALPPQWAPERGWTLADLALWLSGARPLREHGGWEAPETLTHSVTPKEIGPGSPRGKELPREIAPVPKECPGKTRPTCHRNAGIPLDSGSVAKELRGMIV